MSDKRPNVYGISRDLWEHPVFMDESFTEKQAWAWLIGAAAWKQIDARGNVGPVTLSRAEFSFSIRFLARRWKWDKAKVHRFFGKLKRHGMVTDSERDGNQVFLISNYNKFQIVASPKRDTTETPPRQERDKEETGEALKQKNKEPAPDGAPALALVFQFPSWWPHPEWEGYLEMRKKLRKAASQRAIELVVAEVTKLRAAGHDPAAVLDRSTIKGWTDVYPLKDGSRPALALVPAPVADAATWARRLEYFYRGNEGDEVEKGYWAQAWGPEPGRSGCKAPDDAHAIYRAKFHPPKGSAAS